MKKLIRIVILLLLWIYIFAVPVSATESSDFLEQVKSSGAEALPEQLPEGTGEILADMGVGDFGENILDEFTVDSVLDTVTKEMVKESAAPLRSLGTLLGMILFTALVASTKDTLAGKPLHTTYNAVTILAILTAIVLPVIACIDRAAGVIEGAFVFMSAFVPVYAGVAIASGQVITGATYNAVMFSVSEVISGGAGLVVVPVIKSTLALSLVSSLSTKIKLTGLVNIIHKSVKWALTFCMTVFTGVLALNSAVGSAGDSVAVKSTRFVIGNFVPVVGGAISDAYSSVLGCIKLLKSSVGAFGIIAAFSTFLPVLLETVLWLLCLHLCAAIGGIFDNRAVESMMKAVCAGMEILLALLLCCLTVLVVSTGILLASGGGSV